MFYTSDNGETWTRLGNIEELQLTLDKKEIYSTFKVCHFSKQLFFKYFQLNLILILLMTLEVVQETIRNNGQHSVRKKFNLILKTP